MKRKTAKKLLKNRLNKLRKTRLFVLVLLAMFAGSVLGSSHMYAKQLDQRAHRNDAKLNQKLAQIKKARVSTVITTTTSTSNKTDPPAPSPTTPTPQAASEANPKASTPSKPAAKPASPSNPVASSPAPPASTTTAETASSLSYINNVRSSAGKSALIQNGVMNNWALAHAQTLAQQCTLYHQSLGSFLGQNIGPTTVHSIAENVGYGGTIQIVLDGLKNSPGHYANMTGDYLYVGLGVVTANSGSCAGYVYTTQMFAK